MEVPTLPLYRLANNLPIAFISIITPFSENSNRPIAHLNKSAGLTHLLDPQSNQPMLLKQEACLSLALL